MKQSLRIVLLLGLLACIWSLVPIAQSTGTVSNPEVECPLCDTCHTKSDADMKVFSKALTEGKTYTVYPDSNGKIKFTFNWPSYSSDECCSPSNIPTISGKITGDSGAKEDTFSLGTEKVLTVSEWKFPIKLKVYSTRGASSESCLTYTLKVTDCESCADASCPAAGSINSADFSIPLGTSGNGDLRAALFAQIETLPHPGRSALKLTAPTGITPTLDGSGNIVSVSTDSVSATVATTTTTYDNKAYTVTLSHPGGAAFRTVKIEAIDTGNASKKLRLTDTRTGEAGKVMEWTQTVASPVTTWVFTEAGGLRTTAMTKTAVNATHRTERITISEKNAANADTVVSDRLLKYVLVGGNWEIEREEIDPDHTPLVTTWSYYGIGDTTGFGGSTEGVGFLHQMQRYDGYSEVHTYWRDGSNNRQHAVAMPFGAGGTMTKTTEWNNTASTETETTVVGTNLLAKTVTTFGTSTKTTDIYTDATHYLRTVTAYATSGKPATITHPDGTKTIYTYAPAGADRTTTVKTGAPSGADISDGTKTVTTTNAKGRVTESVNSIFINSGATETITDHWKIATADDFGRPLTIRYFPVGASAASWTITQSYDCCGLASETDRYGVVTNYAHDGLKRQTSMERLDVVTATIYDGLTTRIKRGPLNGTLVEIENTFRNNLKGTLVTNSGPSPQSGALEQLSSTAITYANPAGTSGGLPTNIGQRTVTTVIQVTDDGAVVPSQTEDRYLDGRVHQSSGDLSSAIRFAYAAEAAGLATTRSYVDGANLRESTTTHTDCAGHTTSIDQLNEAGATVTTTYAYATGTGAVSGQLLSVTDPDGVKTLYGYNTSGERYQTALRLTSTATGIDLASDQVTETTTNPGTYTPSGGSSTSVITTETKVYPSGSTPVTASTTHRTSDGLSSWTVIPGVANASSSVTSLSGSGAWTETTTRPDGTRKVVKYGGGRRSEEEELDSTGTTGNLISRLWYSYDVFNRVDSTADERSVAINNTTLTYRSDISDVVMTVTDPSPATGRPINYTYDHRGRRTSVDAPNTVGANTTYTSYYPDGKVKATYGDQTYTTYTTYDYAQRIKTLRTSPTLDGSGVPTNAGGALTTWNYEATTGRLQTKLDANSDGPVYHYTAAGRLKSRTWDRGKDTRYAYRSGRLVAVRHFNSDATTATSDVDTGDIGISYDRLGRPLWMVTAATSAQPGTSIGYSYTTAFKVDKEAFTVDPDLTFTLGTTDAAITIDTGSAIPPSIQRVLHRKTDSGGFQKDGGADLRIDASGTSGLVVGTSFAYHAYHGRLSTVTANLNATNRTFTYGYEPLSYSLIGTVTGPVHTVTNTWEDTRDVLHIKANTDSALTGNFSTYTYGVNDIGQRESVDASGSAFGSTDAGDWSWNYNSRGELVSGRNKPLSSSSSVSRFFEFDAIGNRLRHREGTYQDTTGSGITTTTYSPNTRNQYATIVPPSGSLSPAYDTDGNLTAGPLPIAPTANSDLTWDGENRLLKADPVGSAPETRYLYDGLGRRVMKTTGTASGARTYFFYDGWNLLAEYSGDIHTSGSAPTPALLRTHAWGTDLSGKGQEAGGVGGLLATHLHVGTTGTYYPLFDGNGNVSEYVSQTSGGVVAHYEYGPFGEPLAATGAVAAEMPFRFSTKYQDSETGLLYYGYRYYEPSTGRWLSRDPIEESGGANLYGFAHNDGVNRIDPLGLDDFNATPVFRVTRSGWTVDKPAWDIAQYDSIGGTIWAERAITLGALASYDGQPDCVRVERARSQVDMWYRVGDQRAEQHEERHISDIRGVWNALTAKAVSFTGCCKPKGWRDCYQGVVAKYLDYGLKLSKAISTGRHTSSDPLMRYQNPAHLAYQEHLFQSMRSQAISALIEARVAEKKCADSLKGPQPKMGGETQEVDGFLNRIRQ